MFQTLKKEDVVPVQMVCPGLGSVSRSIGYWHEQLKRDFPDKDPDSHYHHLAENSMAQFHEITSMQKAYAKVRHARRGELHLPAFV